MQITETERIGDARSEKSASQRQAVDDKGRVEQVPRRQFDSHFVAFANVESGRDMSLDAPALPAATEYARATALPRGATRTAERCRYFDNGGWCFLVDGKDPSAGLFHSCSVPQATVRMALPSVETHRLRNLFDGYGRHFPDSRYAASRIHDAERVGSCNARRSFGTLGCFFCNENRDVCKSVAV